MIRCEFCGSLIPEYASFCGQCGRVPTKVLETKTIASDIHLSDIQNFDTSTNVSVPSHLQSNMDYNQQTFISNLRTTTLNNDEEEEESRRRAALLGMGIPLLGSLAVEGTPNVGNVPMIEGTPHMSGVPTVQGSPYPPAGSMGQALYSNPSVMAPQIPTSIAVSPLPASTTVTLQPPHHLHHPSSPSHKPHGCSTIFIISAIIIPVLILLSFIGLGLTLFAPSLSLSGSTIVVQGGNFTLHGSHFIPGSSVTLTLDATVTIYFSSRSLPTQSTHMANPSWEFLTLDTPQAKQVALSNHTLSVGADGTFAVTITANPGWSIGKHTITASEAPTTKDSGSPTPSPTTTLTPTATLPGLSCVHPATLSLGPAIRGARRLRFW